MTGGERFEERRDAPDERERFAEPGRLEEPELTDEPLTAADERTRFPDEDVTGAHASTVGTGQGDALLGDDADFSRRWDDIQADFVDDPHGAVSAAGMLVEEVLARLSDTFKAERDRAEASDRKGEETENLRLAMQRYREFFRRLLEA
jgi:hypothetical protein